MHRDLRQVGPGCFERDPLAVPTSEIQADCRRRRILNTLVAARRAGDHVLACRLLGELVALNEEEERELRDA